MSTVLVKGQNMPLTARQLRVTVQVAHPADLSALLVTASGKVRSDADFVFFNQPNGPGVTCQQPTGGQPWRIDLDLDRVPGEIDKVRVVSSLDGDNARFGQFAPPVTAVTDAAGTPLAEYTMSGLDTESIVIAVEAYRRGGEWKLRAVGQGYAGGLADLVTDHGVSVDDAGPQAPAATPQAPPAPAAPMAPPVPLPGTYPPPGPPPAAPPTAPPAPPSGPPSAPPSGPPTAPPSGPPTAPPSGPPSAPFTAPFTAPMPTPPGTYPPPGPPPPAAPPSGPPSAPPSAPPTGQFPAAPGYPPQQPPQQPGYPPQQPPQAPGYPPQQPPQQPGYSPQQPPQPPGYPPPAPNTGQFPTAPMPAGPPPGPPQDVVPTPGRPVSLTKGQRISLQKQDGSSLALVRMGLGWDPIKKRGMFGSREIDIDLDASAVLFADHQPVDIAFFNQLRTKDGSVAHTGDNRTGAGEGDDESIMVELTRVPAHVNTIFFVVTSYEGQTFQQVQNAFCRLVDESTRAELARYTLSGGEAYTAMVMAKVFRDGNSWKMQAIGEGAQGKTALDLVPHLTRMTY